MVFVEVQPYLPCAALQDNLHLQSNQRRLGDVRGGLRTTGEGPRCGEDMRGVDAMRAKVPAVVPLASPRCCSSMGAVRGWATAHGPSSMAQGTCYWSSSAREALGGCGAGWCSEGEGADSLSASGA